MQGLQAAAHFVVLFHVLPVRFVFICISLLQAVLVLILLLTFMLLSQHVKKKKKRVEEKYQVDCNDKMFSRFVSPYVFFIVSKSLPSAE